MGQAPKDFDISTNARPEQVHRIFPSSRIIGRRFKIVHVVYGNEIIEVTTFRSASNTNNTVQSSEGMLVRDNSYGNSIEEDSQRRDFTINAVYYDIGDFSLKDFHGGLYDLNRGVIDIIGDPDRRYQEDPVRMIRAIRFKAKLGFKIAKRTEEPISRLSGLLLNISNARMFDEVNKLFLTGHGLQSFRELKHYKIFDLLFPGLENFTRTEKYNSFIEYALTSSDQRTRLQKRNKPHFLYTVMLWPRIEQELFKLKHANNSTSSPLPLDTLIARVCDKALREQCQVTAIPIAIMGDIKQLITMVFHITDENLEAGAISRIASKGLFRAAFDIIKLRAQFEPELIPFVKFWQHYYDEAQLQLQEKQKQQNERQASREKKRREREEKASRRRESRKKQNSGSNQSANSSAGADFDKDTSRERQERLARARAWRAAMNLDP